MDYEINCIIEIPKGGRLKYEIDHNNNLILDRVLPLGCVYPGNYGYIPDTLGGDGDPLDILIITQYPIQSKCHVLCRPVGVLHMKDEKGIDEKIIAVPIRSIDKMYSNIEDLSDIPNRQLKEIKYFFETYKKLEEDKWTKVMDFKSAYHAEKLIKQYQKDYVMYKKKYFYIL